MKLYEYSRGKWWHRWHGGIYTKKGWRGWRSSRNVNRTDCSIPCECEEESYEESPLTTHTEYNSPSIFSWVCVSLERVSVSQLRWCFSRANCSNADLKTGSSGSFLFFVVFVVEYFEVSIELALHRVSGRVKRCSLSLDRHSWRSCIKGNVTTLRTILLAEMREDFPAEPETLVMQPRNCEDEEKLWIRSERSAKKTGKSDVLSLLLSLHHLLANDLKKKMERQREEQGLFCIKSFLNNRRQTQTHAL